MQTLGVWVNLTMEDGRVWRGPMSAADCERCVTSALAGRPLVGLPGDKRRGVIMSLDVKEWGL